MENQIKDIDICGTTQETCEKHMGKENPDDGITLNKVDCCLNEPEHHIKELNDGKDFHVFDFNDAERRTRDENSDLITDIEDDITVFDKEVWTVTPISSLGSVGTTHTGNILKEINKNQVERRPPDIFNATL